MPTIRPDLRREFIRLTAASGLLLAGPAGAPRRPPRLRSAGPPGERLQIATFGVGIQGRSDTRTALSLPGVELVAVADVYDGRLALAKETWGDHIFTSRDYREVLARPDVDAVIIATPDHWHARIAIDAMKAGKDVYVEKPIVQDIEEGRPVIEAEQQTRRILQVGSQRVSSMVYAKARELLRAGAIGESTSSKRG